MKKNRKCYTKKEMIKKSETGRKRQTNKKKRNKKERLPEFEVVKCMNT